MRIKTRLFPGLLLATLASISCSDSEEYRIGVEMSFDAWGAAQLAMEVTNAEGGVAGRNLSVVQGEFASPGSAAPAIANATQFSADPNLIAVIGPSNSAAALASAPIFNERHLPHIAPSATAPAIRNAGPYTFTLLPNDTRQGPFIASGIDQFPEARRIAIVYVNDDYGRALFTQVTRSLASGTHEVMELPYLEAVTNAPAGDSAAGVNNYIFDYIDPVATRLMRETPDLIVWLGRPAPYAEFRRKTAHALKNIPVLGSDAFDARLVYEDGTDTFDNLQFVRVIDPADYSAEISALRTRFVELTGTAFISSEALLTYDAVRLIANGLRSGARTRRRLRDYIAAIGITTPPYEGVSGQISFDAEGEARRDYHWAIVTGNDVTRKTAQ